MMMILLIIIHYPIQQQQKQLYGIQNNFYKENISKTYIIKKNLKPIYRLLKMIRSKPTLKQTISLKSFPKHSYSVQRLSLSPPCIPSDYLRKVQTKKSLICQTIKSNIFNDDNYNTMIYQWRKSQSAPIIRVLQISKINQINSFTGLSYTHKTIKPQPIQHQLSHYNHFTKQQLLFILKCMLDGHQAIFKKLKATSVSLDKTFITQQGQIKVWINQHLQRNDISGQILNKQEDIVKRIFQTVGFLDTNQTSKLKDFTDYVNSAMKRNGHWQFSYLRALIRSYSDCLKMKVPKILSKYQKSNKKYIQYSLIQNPMNQQQNQKQNSKRLLRYNLNKNFKSSLHCSQSLRRQSQTSQQSQSNYPSINISKTSTSKSINQKSSQLYQSNSNNKKFFSRNKHTSSISGLLSQPYNKDIFQNSNNNTNILKSNIFLNNSQVQQNNKQHKKALSFNQILLSKIGFGALPQVQDQYTISPNKKVQLPTQFSSLNIIQQYNIKINKNNEQLLLIKPVQKNSTISTNQTSLSGYQFNFNKKLKDSYMTINLDQKQKHFHHHNQAACRTSSKDRFKDKINNGEQNKKQNKKTMNSCTNWSNRINNVEINKQEDILQTKEQQHEDSIRSQTKLQIDKQVISYKNLQQLSSKQILPSPQQSAKDLLKKCLKNPLTFFKQLKSQQQIQSSQKSQRHLNDHHHQLLKGPVQQKILELLNLNKRLVISTYMQTQSQKKLKLQPTPLQHQKSEKLKQFQQTINSLMKANIKQQQILQGNCWTKTLQTLLNLQNMELKQSISVQEANTLIRQLKLSKLGKCGRQVGQSLIP